MTHSAHATVRAWFNAHLNGNALDTVRALCVAEPQMHWVMGALNEPFNNQRIRTNEVLPRIEIRELRIVALQGDEQLVATRWVATLAVRPDAEAAPTSTAAASAWPARDTPLIIEGSTWFRLEQGLIAETWEHWDCEPLLARLAIAPG